RSARHGAHRAAIEGRRGFVDEPRRRMQGVQQPQGQSHAGSRRDEAALRAVCSESVRGVHPEQPQDSRRPDGVSAPGRAEELADARGDLRAAEHWAPPARYSRFFYQHDTIGREGPMDEKKNIPSKLGSATLSQPGLEDLLAMSSHASGFKRENAVRRLGML